MEKAYDFSDLGARFKEAGLDMLEENLAKSATILLGWLKDSAILSKEGYDDLMLPFLPKIEEFAQEKIDKIDGKEG